MSVEEGSIVFKVNKYDYDERPRTPYTVLFNVEDIGLSTYRFDADLRVKFFKADSETYKVRYRADGSVREVILEDSKKRTLFDAGHDGYHDEDATKVDMPVQKRRLYSRDDCEADWYRVCNTGIPTVCNLDGHSSLSVKGALSVAILCGTFGASCSNLAADAACNDQCIGE